METVTSYLKDFTNKKDVEIVSKSFTIEKGEVLFKSLDNILFSITATNNLVSELQSKSHKRRPCLKSLFTNVPGLCLQDIHLAVNNEALYLISLSNRAFRGGGGGGAPPPDVQVWYGGVNTWNVCANNTFRKFQLHDSRSLDKLRYVLTV